MPRLPRPGPQRGARVDIPTTYLLVFILCVAAAGWFQLSRYEARLHALREQEAAAAANLQGVQGYPSFKASMRQGPQSTSSMCAATLEALGLVPNAEGRRANAAGAREEAADEAGAGDPAAAQAAAAAAVTFLHSRRQLYDSMEASLRHSGLALASGSTQGMGLGDMFRRGEGGVLLPVLTALKVPVRAVVLPLIDQQVAGVLAAAVQHHLAPLVPQHGMWVQNSSLYHSTIYHASTHLDPVPASGAEIDAEERAIQEVGRRACPITVVLERVVATPSGTVLACWQVSKGTDVFDLRRQLAEALPSASKQQIVQDRTILHTTLARIVQPPQLGEEEQGGGAASAAASAARQTAQAVTAGVAEAAAAEEAAMAAALLQKAVGEMTTELCGLQAVMDRLWFVEEHHKLALALGGSFRERVVPLQCERSQAGSMRR